MSKDITDLHDTVSEIVAGCCRRPYVNGDQHLINDLGFDSLDFIGLVSELEERFDISVPDEDVYLAENFGTANRIVEYVSSRIKSE